MIRRVVGVALVFVTPAGAQICRGHQSFSAHRARAALQVLDRPPNSPRVSPSV
jgi:hypothetical protein